MPTSPSITSFKSLSKNRSIVVAGYYGCGNLGDELILLAIVKALVKPDEFLKLTVLSGEPKQTSAWFGVSAVHRFNPLKVCLAIRQSSLFILGGGGLLQDRTGLLTMIYYLSLVLLAWLMKRPVFLYAIGVEGKPKRISRWLIRLVLGITKPTITVRDAESAQDLASCGVNPSRIQVATDPCFGLFN